MIAIRVARKTTSNRYKQKTSSKNARRPAAALNTILRPPGIPVWTEAFRFKMTASRTAAERGGRTAIHGGGHRRRATVERVAPHVVKLLTS